MNEIAMLFDALVVQPKDSILVPNVFKWQKTVSSNPMNNAFEMSLWILNCHKMLCPCYKLQRKLKKQH